MGQKDKTLPQPIISASDIDIGARACGGKRKLLPKEEKLICPHAVKSSDLSLETK